MANEMTYNSGNLAAKDKINPEIANNPSIFVPADYMPKMIQPSSFTNEAREAMANAYNAFKQGK
jgi:putrescine transport system substrate-binding protein